ncbi:MAG: ABC transporter permease [Myxococcales bacterium]|nr:ABC transporter permease [Myxococcales bacterium]
MALRSGILDTARMALQTPARNPGRTALTVLGLSIGVGAFIAMVSFGQSAQRSVVSQFESLGSNLLRVEQAHGRLDSAPRPLDASDLAALRSETTAIARVVPLAMNSLIAVHGARRHRTLVRGTSPDFVHTANFRVAHGSLFDDSDMQLRNKVCVLGQSTALALFDDEAPLGRSLTLDRKLPCRVVGVLATRGTSMVGSDLDEGVWLPLSTFEVHLGTPRGLSQIELQPHDRSLLGVARNEVRQVLRRTHAIAERDPEDFNIKSPDEVTRVAERIGGILTGLLAGIAAVSLLVGGIGIMNIQLVAVSERTHEIGIRTAIGASPGQVLGQFVAEAMVLAVLGSGAGVVLGVASATAVARQLGWPEAVNPTVVLGSFGFGVAVGTIFGYIPARRAAALTPIDALRRE